MASAQILTSGKALYAFNGTEWVPLNTTGNLVNSTRWQYTATGSETSLSGNDDYGDPLIYTPGYEQLFLNGILLARDVDYTASNGTTVTGLATLNSGDIVEIVAYNNINVGNTYTQNQIDTKISDTFSRWTKTLSASATVLSGLDDDSNTLSYTPGLEKVYVNGILLAPEEYTATSGSSVTLDEAGVVNDIIQIQTFKNFRVANHYTISQTDDQFLSKTDASSTYLTQAAGITAATASATYLEQGNEGLIHLNTTEFTGQSTVSIDNVFSSTYEFYTIQIKAVCSLNTQSFNFRWRYDGSDLTGSSYYGSRWSVTTGGSGSGAGQSATTSFALNQIATGYGFYTMFAGHTQTEPRLNGNSYNSEISAMGLYAMGYRATSVADGFTIYSGGGTITGTVSVYGHKK